VSDRILTLNRAGLLADLIHAVQRKSKLRYYPRGVDPGNDALMSMTLVLRAFSHDGGGLWFDNDGDVRDAFVWCSGFMERWLKVDDIIDAMENHTDMSHGETAPMAIIDNE
jgi:hypothetical protein